MSLAALGLRTTNLTITQACCEIRAAASIRPRLYSVGVIQATGTAQSLGFGRPAAIGVTPVPVLFQRYDPNDPACVTAASLSWATSPTAPPIFLNRWNSAATIGVGVLWSFPNGIEINASASYVVWNITAAVASDVNILIDE
jgi:hypothetical protein